MYGVTVQVILEKGVILKLHTKGQYVGMHENACDIRINVRWQPWINEGFSLNLIPLSGRKGLHCFS